MLLLLWPFTYVKNSHCLCFPVTTTVCSLLLTVCCISREIVMNALIHSGSRTFEVTGGSSVRLHASFFLSFRGQVHVLSVLTNHTENTRGDKVGPLFLPKSSDSHAPCLSIHGFKHDGFLNGYLSHPRYRVVLIGEQGGLVARRGRGSLAGATRIR